MATHASEAHASSSGGAATLPAAFAIVLALIWGAYTMLVIYEIASLPMPAISP
ncbi:MAG: hypothetical protein U1E03_07390 [Hyphomonadaceae bacterium]